MSDEAKGERRKAKGSAVIAGWPFYAFALGQVWLGAAVWNLLGAAFAFGWWGLWLVGAALVEWFGPES